MKYSRCRTVCTKTNTLYRISEAAPANTSCDVVSVGPGVDSVNDGQDQSDRGQRGQHRECRSGSFDAEGQHAMTQGAQQQADAQDDRCR
jgi:hypothetical protein